jgi:type IV fimbrial biogenesis protein FimT
MKKPKNQGFTLIELMLAIMLLAIVLAIGVPSFRTQLRNSEVTAATNALVHSLTLARSEAVKSNRAVSFNAKSGGWTDGWTVVRADGLVVRDFNDPPSGGTITGKDGVDPIVFGPMGTVTTGECFDIAVTDSNKVRSVLVSASGRATTCEATCAAVVADYSACK